MHGQIKGEAKSVNYAKKRKFNGNIGKIKTNCGNWVNLKLLSK